MGCYSGRYGLSMISGSVVAANEFMSGLFAIDDHLMCSWAKRGVDFSTVNPSEKGIIKSSFSPFSLCE